MPAFSKHPTPGNFWRKLALQVVAVLGALVLLIGGGYYGWKAWQGRSLLSQARASFEKGDFPSALLSARRAIELNPSSEPATRLIADVADRAGAADSVGWRRRVAELNPGSAADALAWARTAIKFRNFTSAQQALDSMPAAESAEVAQLRAAALVGLGKPREAGKWFADAARLAPADELARYNHAHWVIEFDPAPAARDTATQTLRELTASARAGLSARRALLSPLIQLGKWNDALVESTPIVAHKDATIPDRITHLDLLARLKNNTVKEFLAATKAAAKTAPDVVAVLHWMAGHSSAADAVAWAGTLGADILKDPAVSAGLADCLDLVGDWKRLRDHAIAGNWAALDPLRHAYVSRAQRQLGDIVGAGTHWTAAAGGATSPEIAGRLILLTTRWDWRGETRELLWRSAEGPQARSALESLTRLYHREQDTDGLLRATMKLAELDPANDAARNNIAALSLLLNRDIPRSTELAASLFAKHPTSVGIASTHALALHKTGRSADGLAVFAKFPAVQLREPTIAATYGVLLAEAGRPEAREFLGIAAKAPLLPPERTLVEEAMKKAQ